MLKRKIALLMSAALVAALSMGVLTGCGGNPEEEITGVLTQELDQVKNLSDEYVTSLTSSMGTQALTAYGIDMTDFVKTYLDGFDYKIGAINVDGDKATAEVTLSCKSYKGFESALTTAVENAAKDPNVISMSQADINAYMGTLIMDTLKATPVAECAPMTIELTDNGGWAVDASAESAISKAMLSN